MADRFVILATMPDGFPADVAQRCMVIDTEPPGYPYGEAALARACDSKVEAHLAAATLNSAALTKRRT